MPFVVDASMIAAWLLPDEAKPSADALLDRLAETRPVAPDLLAHEVRSLIAKAVRRKRVAPEDIDQLIRRFDQLGVVDAGPGDMRGVLALALKHGLTPYDAAYLDLAMDRMLPLASLDAELREAAKAEGVALLPETP